MMDEERLITTGFRNEDEEAERSLDAGEHQLVGVDRERDRYAVLFQRHQGLALGGASPKEGEAEQKRKEKGRASQKAFYFHGSVFPFLSLNKA